MYTQKYKKVSEKEGTVQCTRNIRLMIYKKDIVNQKKQTSIHLRFEDSESEKETMRQIYKRKWMENQPRI